MKIKTAIIAAVGLMLTAGLANATHIWEDSAGWWDAHFAYDQNAPKYSAQELSLDLFGSYLNPEGQFNDLFETSLHHGVWGGGAGLNYFLTREIGLGVDFNMSAKPSEFRGVSDPGLVDYTVGNLYFRLPVGNSGVAPYIYGGGGRQFTPHYDWVYGGGVGLEYRLNPLTGIFTDARFLWADKGTVYNSLVMRIGVRLVF